MAEQVLIGMVSLLRSGAEGLPCFVESPARLDARLVRKETLPIDNLSEP